MNIVLHHSNFVYQDIICISNIQNSQLIKIVKYFLGKTRSFSFFTFDDAGVVRSASAPEIVKFVIFQSNDKNISISFGSRRRYRRSRVNGGIQTLFFIPSTTFVRFFFFWLVEK